MSAPAFRFLHCADLHLGRPFFGVPQLPEPLHELAVDAPILAAKQVFDTAVAEHVDFVVVSGDLVNPRSAGPRALALLLEQFKRLAEQGIAVYWSGGNVDAPDRWPKTVRLPDLVHVFPDHTPEALTYLRGDDPLAALVGISGTDPHRVGPTALRAARRADFSIAVAYGQADVRALARAGISYWALGGRHQRKTYLHRPTTIHYPGTPQGRSPREPGPHGCTLVSVGDRAGLATQLVETDLVRWRTEHVQLGGDPTPEHLREALGERLLELVDVAPDRTLLVSWKVRAAPARGRLQGDGNLADQLIRWLRREFADAASAVWSVSLELEPPSALPKSWYEENTLLGDFLRALEHYQTQPSEPLELDAYLPSELADSLDAAVQLTDPAKRQRVLREAILLGADLLRGQDAA